MSSDLRLQVVALPAAAAALVAGVLGFQVANGGGQFVPAHTADPCAARTVNSVSTGIDKLAEQLVLLGLDGAACRLHVSREALTLDLARDGTPSDARINALRAGLLEAVDKMKASGTLPKASALTDQALNESNLNRFLKEAIRLLPSSLINSALKTDDVLRRAINNIDLRALLTNLHNPDELNQQIGAAVTRAVKDALIARLRSLL